MLKVIYNFIPKFNFNSNQYKYCNLVIRQTFYYNIFYSFVDSLTSYCVILNNFNTKINNNLLRMYVFNG